MVPFFVLRMYFVLSGALLFAAVSLAKSAAGRRSRREGREKVTNMCAAAAAAPPQLPA
ncbi:hypothetical protein BO85DRAFT_445217 [Aspergillus piperis CBS 112811]|uniref:Uncharacterized protein n=1 Tax=Aspergillus piperis CBS 112811 TaxID=1448313 RepID=A0A8G1VQA0_9EURO|nr:hypothetical protein BO85DRAFT_445217 [Aspergillus piperis CBS 112811]RAH61819.1 hypothetical protein BO85DRAFT_445217 [Aspergillus piperis CBS 112811]